MREVNVFYLHRDARLSARWLHDAHTRALLRVDAELLSTAICMATVEVPSSELFAMIPAGPHVMWLLQSVEHYAWMVSHYTCLAESYRENFKQQHDHWRFDLELKKYIGVFPRNPWSDPPQLVEADCKHADCVTAYRAHYLKYCVTRAAYKKVRRPFWVDDFLARPEADEEMDVTATIENAERFLSSKD